LLRKMVTSLQPKSPKRVKQDGFHILWGTFLQGSEWGCLRMCELLLAVVRVRGIVLAAFGPLDVHRLMLAIARLMYVSMSFVPRFHGWNVQ